MAQFITRDEELERLREIHAKLLDSSTEIRRESYDIGKTIGKVDGWIGGYFMGLMTFIAPIAVVLMLRWMGLI